MDERIQRVAQALYDADCAITGRTRAWEDALQMHRDRFQRDATSWLAAFDVVFNMPLSDLESMR